MSRSRIVPTAIRLKNYFRMTKVQSELYEAVSALEKKYKLTIFELVHILSELSSSFSKSGMELEEEEAYLGARKVEEAANKKD